MKGGKVVAEVPVTWIELQKSPESTEVVLNQNRVVEMDFGGKTQPVKIQSTQAISNQPTDQSRQQ